ncbi:hypothetical protein OAU30_01045 [Candidatus Pelagibacter sp.]|nr:hypothetical protein [Candidatus Pelagibacter sp.]
MKKILLLTKIIFHISNIGLILLYLYPGSIIGWLIYNDFQKQPQIISDFSTISFNHALAFIVFSLLGVISFTKKKIMILFLYLFFISIVLELCHSLIPKRSFEYPDLFGNFLGVFLIFTLFNLYQFLKNR